MGSGGDGLMLSWRFKGGWIFVHPSSEIVYSLIGREIDNFFYAWLEKE